MLGFSILSFIFASSIHSIFSDLLLLNIICDGLSMLYCWLHIQTRNIMTDFSSIKFAVCTLCIFNFSNLIFIQFYYMLDIRMKSVN
jgi:hypothetical protein